MRREPEDFGEGELVLIYIAKRLQEALALEELLTAQGFDYLVEPDTYKGGIIFSSERIGAFFYVEPEHQERAHEVLKLHRYKPYKPH